MCHIHLKKQIYTLSFQVLVSKEIFASVLYECKIDNIRHCSPEHAAMPLKRGFIVSRVDVTNSRLKIENSAVAMIMMGMILY